MSGDLFGHTPAQASLFGDGDGRMANPAAVARLPTPEEVRHKLRGLLAIAREARTMPWDERRARSYQTTFPQMANWLPDDEADQLRFAFAQEMERLRQAA